MTFDLKITHYLVVEGSTLTNLQIAVCDMLRDGWELYGNLIFKEKQ